MSYSSRRRYTTRREKSELIAKRIKATVLIGLLMLAVYAYMNRVWIIDYLKTYFY